MTIRMPVVAMVLALAAPALAQQVGPVAGPRAALPGATARTAATTPGEVPKRAPINGVLVLYGNERCPTDNEGNEIVICERRSPQEQYRVPKELREFTVTPENASWASKAQGVIDQGVGANSIDSCSTVGAGGQTGCFAQQSRLYRQERAAQKAQAAQGQ